MTFKPRFTILILASMALLASACGDSAGDASNSPRPESGAGAWVILDYESEEDEDLEFPTDPNRWIEIIRSTVELGRSTEAVLGQEGGLSQNNYDTSTPVGRLCWAEWELQRLYTQITVYIFLEYYFSEAPTEILDEIYEGTKDLLEGNTPRNLVESIVNETFPSIAEVLDNAELSSNSNAWADYPEVKSYAVDLREYVNEEAEAIRNRLETGEDISIGSINHLFPWMNGSKAPQSTQQIFEFQMMPKYQGCGWIDEF